MEKPIYHSSTRFYVVKAPLLWFNEGDIVECNKLWDYFTPKAITSLLENDLISVKSNFRQKLSK
jgi:hypothetical protein